MINLACAVIINNSKRSILSDSVLDEFATNKDYANLKVLGSGKI